MMKTTADFTSKQIGVVCLQQIIKILVIKYAENHMLLFILYIESTLDQIILFKKSSNYRKVSFGFGLVFFLKIVVVHTQAVFHKDLRGF